MESEKKTSSAVEIMHKRYIKGNKRRLEYIEQESKRVEIAQRNCRENEMDSLKRLLEDLIVYAEEGLSIDEDMAHRIKFFLKQNNPIVEQQISTLLDMARLVRVLVEEGKDTPTKRAAMRFLVRKGL